MHSGRKPRTNFALMGQLNETKRKETTMKTRPQYRVCYSTDSCCDILSYANTEKEAKCMGEDWLMDVDYQYAEEKKVSIEEAKENSGNYYDIYPLEEHEIDDIVKADFLRSLGKSITDKVDEAWQANKHHVGALKVTEEEAKAFAGKQASQYFDGWTEVVLNPMFAEYKEEF